MNSTPQPLATTLGSVLLTQGILSAWDTPSIMRWCDLSTNLSSLIAPWKLWTMPKHDLAKQHGIPR
jgi:hypothetical protein